MVMNCLCYYHMCSINTPSVDIIINITLEHYKLIIFFCECTAWIHTVSRQENHLFKMQKVLWTAGCSSGCPSLIIIWWISAVMINAKCTQTSVYHLLSTAFQVITRCEWITLKNRRWGVRCDEQRCSTLLNSLSVCVVFRLNSSLSSCFDIRQNTFVYMFTAELETMRYLLCKVVLHV